MKSIKKNSAIFWILLALVMLFFAGCTEPIGDDLFIGATLIRALSDLPDASADNQGQLIYVMDSEVFYYSDGTAWVAINLQGFDGTSGDDGSSIYWVGALSTAPTDPEINWTYYDTDLCGAYIWNGTTWQLLCQDGENPQSLNLSGIVNPGSYLTLVHNLNRSDLTFSAQFIKDTTLYDWHQYKSLFRTYTVESMPIAFNNESISEISAVTLPNGNVFLVYLVSTVGYFVICSSEGEVLHGPTNFGNSTSSCATTLIGNKVLLSYNYNGPGPNGLSNIYDIDGSLLTGPSSFYSGYISDIHSSSLQNGNTFIAFSNNSNSNFGTFIIFNQSLNEIFGPTVFESADTTKIKSCTLSNGNIFITYRDTDNSDAGTFVIYSPLGELLYEPMVFSSSATLYNRVIPIEDGALIAYTDDSTFASFVIYGPDGVLYSDPVYLTNEWAMSVRAESISDGGALISCRLVADDTGRLFSLDSNGNLNGTTLLPEANWGALTTVPNNKVFFAYNSGLLESYYCGASMTLGGDSLLRLSVEDNNEVRLWNETGETLQLILSLDQ